MKIEFLAHASFLMTNENGHTFMTDPYESGSFSGRVGYAPIDVSPDVIIITHDHADHSHTATIPGQFDVVRHHGRPFDVPVRSVQVYHDMEQGRRFGGVIDMKIFTIDGVTFCHCGDIGELLEDEEKRQAIGPIDVLIIPTGGYYTLGPEGAAEVTKKLDPKIVIPCHYKTDFCGFDIAPVAPFLDHFDRVRHVHSSRVALTINELPDELECWVLEMTYARTPAALGAASS
ncbi:MAG: MBL fold metallo-hydrolase [Myxococcota bacterium]|nr:MBL fold metallo-hydrolase [Myxococcota bacterium]